MTEYYLCIRIPPYWVSRAARMTSKEGENSLPEELELTGTDSSSRNKFGDEVKVYLVKFLKDYGFFGVLAMASWPNLAFDLCGIICGHYLMPFNVFFIATLLGKAVVRNSYQSLLYVALCSEEYLDIAIRYLQYFSPDFLRLDQVCSLLLKNVLYACCTSENSLKLIFSPKSDNIFLLHLAHSRGYYVLPAKISAPFNAKKRNW